MNQIRVGEGWDVHALVEGRRLVLGGVEVPYAKGLLGQADIDGGLIGGAALKAETFLPIVEAAK